MEHRILLVEDDPATQEALAVLLRDCGYDVVTADDGTSALSLVERCNPDLVITDLVMPGVHGLALIEALRKQPDTSEVPVIVLSGQHGTRPRTAAFRLGADDFVPKPVAFDELVARLERHLERSHRQREAVRQSVVDELTGVLNRRGIANFYQRELERDGAPEPQLSVLLVDLDQFKRINDHYGHEVGDLTLTATARALQAVVRATDRVGRVGGDEFLIVLPGTDSEALEKAAQRVKAQAPLEVALPDGDRILVDWSLGGASAHQGEDLTALMARADRAMYVDKAARRLD